jgi:hypothetical protein
MEGIMEGPVIAGSDELKRQAPENENGAPGALSRHTHPCADS